MQVVSGQKVNVDFWRFDKHLVDMMMLMLDAKKTTRHVSSQEVYYKNIFVRQEK